MKNRKYGYIDRLKNVRIDPIWDDILNSWTLAPSIDSILSKLCYLSPW